jgi:hypothetical protein
MAMKKKPTLAEYLAPQVAEAREAAVAVNEGILIEASRSPYVRARRAKLARVVMRRLAARMFPGRPEQYVTIAELRQLCGAALAHESMMRPEKKRKRPR